VCTVNTDQQSLLEIIIRIGSFAISRLFRESTSRALYFADNSYSSLKRLLEMAARRGHKSENPQFRAFARQNAAFSTYFERSPNPKGKSVFFLRYTIDYFNGQSTGLCDRYRYGSYDGMNHHPYLPVVSALADRSWPKPDWSPDVLVKFSRKKGTAISSACQRSSAKYFNVCQGRARCVTLSAKTFANTHFVLWQTLVGSTLNYSQCLPD
jgi:hypothetical protein